MTSRCCPCLCVCLCIPLIDTMQRLGKSRLIIARQRLRFLYCQGRIKGKQENSSSQNFLLHVHPLPREIVLQAVA
jgi:hypothetical protein